MDSEDETVTALAITIDEALRGESKSGFLLLITTEPDGTGRFQARSISSLSPRAQRDLLTNALRVAEERLKIEGRHYDA